MNSNKITDWLPISRKLAEQRGWDELDIVLLTGDAYVDHPSFGAAVIGRLIEAEGFRVGIIAQPNWQDDLRDFKKLGKPRLFFGVTAGNMDSMVNHYTAAKRLRSDDAYTAGGKAGFRPDYPSIVYSKILKQIYPDVPIVLGGIEASLRRVTHYDYWQDCLRPTILQESGADLLIYGMGEQPLIELLRMLGRGVPFSSLKTIRQTAFLQPVKAPVPGKKKWESLELASFEACSRDSKVFANTFKQIEKESNKRQAQRLLQKVGDQVLVVNPPFQIMDEAEIDRSFDLPYTRLPHPKYKKRGPVPAFEMIKHSINLHRGCFGGCSFCTISAHQGRFIVSRSEKSILKEVEKVVSMPDFKGTISDLGGPSANMYKMSGTDLEQCDNCDRPSCIYPKTCKNLITDHKSLVDIYRRVLSHPSVKNAFIGSGIRHDMLSEMDNEDRLSHRAYLEQLIGHHVSGRLKVAPEHTADGVLKVMRKPSFQIFKDFKQTFERICQEKGLNHQLVPYFISSHPGCALEDMAQLALETKKLGYRLEQAQDLTPTPMTLSAVLYYTGYNPYTRKNVYTAKSSQEKQSQRKFIYWYKKENSAWIRDRLKEMGEGDKVKQLFSGIQGSSVKKRNNNTRRKKE